MAVPNRWAVREAAEATFFDIVTGAPKVTLKTLKMTEVTTNGETTYAMGGRGNAKIVGFSGNREARVTIQDAIFDNKALAMLTGKEITTASRSKIITEELVVGASGKLTLSNATVDGEVKVQGQVDPLTAAAGIVSTSDLAPDTKVLVSYELIAATASVITVTAKDFAGTYKLVLDVVVRDIDTGKDYYGQFIAPKVQVENEFTFSFSPDGDPSVLDIPVEILKASGSDNMYELVLFDNQV